MGLELDTECRFTKLSYRHVRNYCTTGFLAYDIDFIE